MRGGKSDEVKRLEQGLAQADDDWLPRAIEAELDLKSPEDLLRLTDYGDRLEDAVKIRNGWLYIMLKRKIRTLGGTFEKYLEAHGRNYWRARDCMNYARAVSRHPALAGALTGRALRHILVLPEPEIHKLEEAITGIPAEDAAKLTRRWIEKEYHKIQEEKASRTRRRPEPSPDEQLKKLGENLVTELNSLIVKALSALRLIAEYKIPAQEFERAKRYQREIEAASNRAAYNLGDPEHKKPPWWERHPKEDDISEEGTAV